ncbi:hypothetical protein MalM25_25430 [Planctomycetes bacterium MalM25]|nr:hypothetical protein MalM25_25430 [Planctomycetes bacterium MalM25]
MRFGTFREWFRMAFWVTVCLSLVFYVLPWVESYFGKDAIEPALTIILVSMLVIATVNANRSGFLGSKLRLSLLDLIVVTTTIALYCTAFSLASPFEWPRTSGLFQGLIGWWVAAFVYRLVGNHLYFTERWSNPGAYLQQLVPARFVPRDHLIIASALLLLVVILKQLQGGEAFTWVFLILIGAAIRAHLIAYERTAIWQNSDAVRLLSKWWCWEDGNLRLIRDRAATRLAPSDGSKNLPASWWPLVPDGCVSQLEEVLASKRKPKSSHRRTSTSK